MSTIHRDKPRPTSLLTAAIFAGALAALFAGALFPVFPRKLDIRAGDIAARTLRAPHAVSYDSTVLTRQAQDARAAAVTPSLVFDPNVRSQQEQQYTSVITQIDNIRREQLDPGRKLDLVAQVPVSSDAGTKLTQRSVATVLALPDDRWATVVDEGRRVLDQELGASLDESTVGPTRDRAASLIGPTFNADEALLAAELIRPHIVSTVVADSTRTEAARQAARASVAPVHTDVQKQEIILEAGSRVDDVATEKLRQVGLLSTGVNWMDVGAIMLLSLLAAAAVAGFIYLMQPAGIVSERHLVALALIATAPLLVAKFYLPIVLPDDSRHFLAYALPVAAAPILVAALLETEVAVVIAMVIGVLIAAISIFLPGVSIVSSVSATDTVRLLIVYAFAPLAGIYVVHRADRLGRYLGAGLAVSLVSYAALVSLWLMDRDHQAADLGWMAFMSGINGVTAGVLAAGAFVTVGVIFGVTTRVQLMEMSQLNAPLLRRLQDEAPGTFHHSIIVGNLAERAADQIGADALLTRVGCYYHDIGKVMQPGMYIENQLGGVSPHDSMDPETSSAVIRQHVSDGLDLARKARLPARVQAFIPEHHGTRLVTYFYRTAAERDPGVDAAKFQYPGPRPQSRETAIVMLADGTEAMIRSSADRSPDRIDQLVDEVIGERMAEGQLDDSDLTLRDIRTIATSFKSTMRAVYHPRVAYPEPTPMENRRRMLRLPLGVTTRPAATSARRGRRKFDA